jgi:hypothetical protein
LKKVWKTRKKDQYGKEKEEKKKVKIRKKTKDIVKEIEIQTKKDNLDSVTKIKKLVNEMYRKLAVNKKNIEKLRRTKKVTNSFLMIMTTQD